MPPTVARAGRFRLFLFSREEPRLHIHVAHPDGVAKFWLFPAVHLAPSQGLSVEQIREAQVLVTAHREEIEDAWNRHFSR